MRGGSKIVAAAAVAGLTAAGCGAAGSAQAAAHEVAAGVPKRTNNRTARVYLVHGVSTKGDNDCASTWRAALWSLKRDGWKGALYTVGYYKADRHCGVPVPGRSRYTPNTSIKELGRAFAWLVYDRDTRYGRSVDVVGHSMGGLVVRAALTGVQKHQKGFPSRLYIANVATLDSPHAGRLHMSCTSLECRQMRGKDGGALLRWLGQNPQSTQGTDWTLIGSDADTKVPTSSALGMKAGHKVRYSAEEHLSHGGVALRPDPSHPARQGYHLWYRNSTRPGTHETKDGWAPLHMVEQALYFWQKW
ncbi:esterase/lipase family protein [Actinoallomurus sp. CA-150999]|uniref:esterase/lipase family protein n=1 Tax=Actinoallomurus sp. CA-150999 TaxID=3239887 RepID=UPI003D94F980